MTAMIELGRRAVACKGWRWLPGMLAISAQNMHGPARVETLDGDSYGTTVIPHAGGPIFAGHHEWSVLGEFPREHTIPDLDDMATLMCMLALWWEAWPADCDDRARMCAEIQDAIVDIERNKLAEALVAALESAP